ncbi:MAG TPA: ribose-phosphate diphosphokinase [Euryarchaeota archaeon]|nr:ribose-phosphate diphosphokinase [Euryarchaeota archaeon]
MIVIGGGSSQMLAREVAGALGCELGSAVIKRFPDGEKYVKVESKVEGEDVVVVQSTSRPQDENLIELFLMLDALSDQWADVTAVLPYYGYGRQDKSFAVGEAVAARTIAKHIEVSARRFITINPHKEYILDYFKIPSVSVDASSLIGEYFKKRDLNQLVVVAPDAGSRDMAQRVADSLGCECANCEKKRLGPGKVITSADNISLSGNDVLIVDDIIDSGGTIVESAKALRNRGAGNIYVACVHPVFTGAASERISKIADELVATNTIQTEYSKISVAGLIADAIRKR